MGLKNTNNVFGFSDLLHVHSVQKNEKPSEKDTFKVEPYVSQFEPSFARKIVYYVASFLSFGLVPLIAYSLKKIIAKEILPATDAEPWRLASCQQTKKSFMFHNSETAQEFDLELEDGTVINGAAIFKDGESKNQFKEKNASEQQWIIRFNGNNIIYEEDLLGSQYIGSNFGVNVLTFNYRGVADSKGEFLNPEDLVADGEACVRYLLSKGVPEENILIHGLSLGGAGTIVASQHEKIGLINERSFGTLSREIGALTKSVFLETICSWVYELDCVSAFDKIKAKKLIVVHKQDLIMPYHESSFYKMMKEFIKIKNPDAVEQKVHKGRLKDRLKPQYKPAHVKLQRQFKNVTAAAHNYNLQNDEAYPRIKEFIRDFFQPAVV